MKTKIITLALLSSLVICSCAVQGLTPRTELKYADISYTRIVNSLTILKEAGKFSEDDIDNIIVFTESGYALLKKWTQSVKSGTRPPNTIDAFNIVIENLIKYKLEGEGNG